MVNLASRAPGHLLVPCLFIRKSYTSVANKRVAFHCVQFQECTIIVKSGVGKQRLWLFGVNEHVGD